MKVLADDGSTEEDGKKTLIKLQPGRRKNLNTECPDKNQQFSIRFAFKPFTHYYRYVK